MLAIYSRHSSPFSYPTRATPHGISHCSLLPPRYCTAVHGAFHRNAIIHPNSRVAPQQLLNCTTNTSHHTLITFPSARRSNKTDACCPTQLLHTLPAVPPRHLQQHRLHHSTPAGSACLPAHNTRKQYISAHGMQCTVSCPHYPAAHAAAFHAEPCTSKLSTDRSPAPSCIHRNIDYITSLQSMPCFVIHTTSTCMHTLLCQSNRRQQYTRFKQFRQFTQ
jgi:hypothetical protein